MIGFSAEMFSRFFSAKDKINDINKDLNGEGTLERFISLQGEEFDKVKDLVDNLLHNLIDSNTAFERFVPFLESEAGFDQKNDTLFLTAEMLMRRAVLRALPYLHTVKGTKLGYIIPFGYLGLTAVVDDEYTGFGFDSPILLDDANRRFDSYKPDLMPYMLHLTGTAELTPELLRAIRSIIVFNQPIDTKLLSISYNGVVIKELTGDYNKDFSDDFLTV